MRIQQFLLFFVLFSLQGLLVASFPTVSHFPNRRTFRPGAKIWATLTDSEASPTVGERSFNDTTTISVATAYGDDQILSTSNSPWQASNAVLVSTSSSPSSSSSTSSSIVSEAEYQRGLLTIGGITLIFASNSPVLHAAFSEDAISAPPPVLLLNAAVSVVALVGLLLGGESLESQTPLPSSLKQGQRQEKDDEGQRTAKSVSSNNNPQATLAWRGGCELGLWKFLGTTANLYGLALTTAGHGALLIQLTTLIVPVVQGLQGVPIPRRIQASIVLALAGVVCFTQDPTGTPSALGDALCVVAAIFYATYDLRLFVWGQRVAPRSLITSKIATQAMLSVLLLLAADASNAWQYLQTLVAPMNGDISSVEIMASQSLTSILPVVLWSGVAVNALAPFLQVGGQQAVGPTRCQTIYASQPLWAAILSYVWLGETIGPLGFVGGSAFLVALFLAATTSDDLGAGNEGGDS